MGPGSCTSGPRSITPQASLYRWRTTDQELGRNSTSRYSIHYSPQNRAVWGWVCPSAGRSLRPMEAGCGLSRTNPRVPSFILCYWPTLRCLLVLQDESNQTTSPWCPALKSQSSARDRRDKCASRRPPFRLTVVHLSVMRDIRQPGRCIGSSVALVRLLVPPTR